MFLEREREKEREREREIEREKEDISYVVRTVGGPDLRGPPAGFPGGGLEDSPAAPVRGYPQVIIICRPDFPFTLCRVSDL